MMLKRSLLKPKYWIGWVMEWHGLTEGITILVKQQCNYYWYLLIVLFLSMFTRWIPVVHHFKASKRIGHGRPFHLSKEERREMRWWPVTCERWRWILCSSSTVEFIWGDSTHLPGSCSPLQWLWEKDGERVKLQSWKNHDLLVPHILIEELFVLEGFGFGWIPKKNAVSPA